MRPGRRVAQPGLFHGLSSSQRVAREASDLLDDIRDVGLRFDAVEFGGLDDGVDGPSPFPSSL